MPLPPAVQHALQAGPGPRRSTSKRESMQRATKWWLPYMILEFDRSQMLVDAIDGDIANPIYNYRTPLYASPSLMVVL
jgi:serum/glucocorticoid-regulated kinase 2